MSNAPRILFIDSSPSETSRSRRGMETAVATAREAGAKCDVVRAARWPLVECGDVTPEVEDAQRMAGEADAWVVCGPVHDWNPAPHLMNALIHLLDGEGPRYRPMLFIAGAGSVRSTLAFGAAIQMVTTEVGATVVGAPVVIAGDDVDKESGELQLAVAGRVADQVRMLLVFAMAWRDGGAK